MEADRLTVARDALHLSTADRVLLGGCALTLLSLLLPWWDSGFGRSADGLHDWGWLSFLALLLVAALFVVRRVVRLDRAMPRMSVRDGTAYVAGGALEMLGAVAFWTANNARLSGTVRYGVFVCVVGGAVTVAGGYLRQLEPAPPPPE